jgi:hypothetical protein
LLDLFSQHAVIGVAMHFDIARWSKSLQFVPNLLSCAFPMPSSTAAAPSLLTTGKMIALKDEKGDPVFESIAITLVCGTKRNACKHLAFQPVSTNFLCLASQTTV